ncbi:homogentisate 1,2-dioxygenase [Hortaea werneckii]|nr:homogentisate 1,2-dioxygenase [Hortaea werneckii]KAI7240680.1 homogentisate 1,2-dioxygenase [Hortaea werneckii]KAI7324406.1 homogentisate 1,2-dioxygenase [Hortaea werneckii]KAI7399873.1 homogentisate 1,2-dioxygenase [Hortaea werneckii]
MPPTHFDFEEKYGYLNGFGSHHESEALPHALPVGMNSPQKPPYGLYAEKLSGTAFTAPRHENQQSWLYRIVPAAAHTAWEEVPQDTYSLDSLSGQDLDQIPNQLRWDPFNFDSTVDWIHGLHLVAGAGDPAMKSGLAIFVFAAGKDMDEREAFYSADGDMLIVPQHGVLDITTEFGPILVRANEICVIPRGVRYRVILPNGPVRGYICELYQGHFQLPDLGPIGSNGLANARDFQAPMARYEKDHETWKVVSKFNKKLYQMAQYHTPFDVVAWHGNYYPYKYDLGRFNAIGSISFDHPDPSIFTVLTSPSSQQGTAIADFVIFPPRWLVQEGTFRPPWYHRNTMSEFMGLIAGDYDAKAGGGFRPAGASLHNVMSAHGPDAATHEAASNASLAPQKVGSGSMAFMFESCLMVGVTAWGLKHCQKVQEEYTKESWETLVSHFDDSAIIDGR